eukprot:scaffold7142_cov171-Amphora_coffeaeformis.AAC.3
MVKEIPSLFPQWSVSDDKPRHIPDTEEIAGYLLTLKHRSVTPDPHSSDRTTQVVNESHPSSHYGSLQETPETPCVEQSSFRQDSNVTPMGPGGELDMPWEQLIGDSKLVSVQDRDLVPDCLFVAMAQMKACRLQPSDRVGSYKSREIGFIGMCCKHCGGQPGFGRYYPNSVRSLAQTTTSQTILKHIGSKCQFCPPEIRDAINELQRHQAIREGFPTGRPRYGSRKIFFQRIWERLHNGENIKAMDEEEALAAAQGEQKEMSCTQKRSSKVVSSDTSVDSSSLESQSDDEIAQANAHVMVVSAKRDRASYAPPEHYFPKRPKHSHAWTAPTPTHYYPHPHHALPSHYYS